MSSKNLPISDKTNYPKAEKHAEYPKMPQVTTPRLTSNDPSQPNAPELADVGKGMQGRDADTPLGGQMSDATTPQHNQGVQQGERRNGSPVETPPTLSPRGSYAQSDLTQSKVMEKNDPTHDDKSFKNRSWEDKNFDNRRMFY